MYYLNALKTCPNNSNRCPAIPLYEPGHIRSVPFKAQFPVVGSHTYPVNNSKSGKTFLACPFCSFSQQFSPIFPMLLSPCRFNPHIHQRPVDIEFPHQGWWMTLCFGNGGSTSSGSRATWLIERRCRKTRVIAAAKPNGGSPRRRIRRAPKPSAIPQQRRISLRWHQTGPCALDGWSKKHRERTRSRTRALRSCWPTDTGVVSSSIASRPYPKRGGVRLP